jgi:hypothetical protein
MKSILDPTFRYYSSVDTDVRRTFARVRAELAKLHATRGKARKPMLRKVVPLRTGDAAA